MLLIAVGCERTRGNAVWKAGLGLLRVYVSREKHATILKSLALGLTALGQRIFRL